MLFCLVPVFNMFTIDRVIKAYTFFLFQCWNISTPSNRSKRNSWLDSLLDLFEIRIIGLRRLIITVSIIRVLHFSLHQPVHVSSDTVIGNLFRFQAQTCTFGCLNFILFLISWCFGTSLGHYTLGYIICFVSIRVVDSCIIISSVCSCTLIIIAERLIA